MPSWSSWLWATGDGEFVIGSAPDCVFGKAITSRMFSSPARMATRRSMPKAKPPCGGAPYSNGLRKNPNLRSASSSAMPSAAKTRRCRSRLVDPDRAGAELPAVEHEVVGLRAHAHRVGLEQVDVVGVGQRERVVAGLRAPAARRRRRRTSGSRRPTRSGTGPRAHGRPAEVVAQLAEHLARRRPLVGDDRARGRRRLRREPLGDRPRPRSATGTWRPASRTSRRRSTFSHTRPLAPSALARSVSLSSWLRPYSPAAPGHVDRP